MKFVLVLLALVPAALAQNPIRGFPPNQWAAEHDIEQKARALAAPDHIRGYLERMAREPHHAGSPASEQVAKYALEQFKEFGLDAHIETFEALMPYPLARTVEMTAPVKYRASLKESALPEDRYSAEPGQLPIYNAYSADGDVTGELVYVNYGSVEDYAYLAKQGIDVKGKIVIARYGRVWRGVKPKLAWEHGALACLIYSDPRDDGYYQGDVYPKGALRPPQGAQRGSVMDMAIYVGDPLSPGFASEKGAKRLSIDEAKTLMKIPVLPISYADATPLLQNLGGPVAPPNWRGALGFTYHIGSGPAVVHINLNSDWSTRPLHDVIATIPGSEHPDEWIIYGNHHDAWVNGASDPISGASSLMETARTLGALLKEGWKPKRTIILALWDGEEFGLLGSTEWAEKHQDELNRKAVLYINSDNNAQGTLNVGGSHTLERFMREVLRDLPDPSGKGSLLESAEKRRTPNPEVPAENPPQASGFHLGPLGSGSDYVAFLDHIGVASINFGFSGPNQGGVYHSIYDDIDWYERFGDPNFVYGKALSELSTTILMRMADAPLLPFEFGEFSRTVHGYVDEIKKEAGDRVDLQPLLKELGQIDVSSKSYEDALASALPRLSSLQLEKVNQALYHSDRALLLPKGLPGRDWYRNQVYAPGLYTGYGAKTLPGIREAVEGSRWEEAGRQAHDAALALAEFNERIEQATKALK